MKPNLKPQFITMVKIRPSRQWLLLVWLMLALTTGVSHKAVAQNCVNATQYPAPFTSPIKGAGPNQITVLQNQQEYNQMTGALAGSAFQSTASIAGTWITVRAGSAAGAIVAQGSTPLNWTASAGGTYFIHYNTNSLCGTAGTNMTTTVENTTPPCANTFQNPASFTSPIKGAAPYVITTSQGLLDFNQMTGAAAGSTFQSTASIAGTWITVRAGTATGALVAQGSTPLNWTASAGGTYFIHYNTNSVCGTAFNYMTSTVENTTPACGANTLQTPVSAFASPIKGAGPYTITTAQTQSQYNQMTGALAGSTFQSTASIAGTWITVRAGTSTGALVAQGSTPLNWTASAGGNYFIHYYTNSACGTSSTPMTSTVENTTPSCANTVQIPTISFPSPIKGAVTYFITDQQTQSQYNQMTGALAGSSFHSTASISDTWITVRAGTATGAVVAQGSSQLNWTASAGGTYFIHYNTNSACGTATSTMISWVGNTTPNLTITGISPASGTTVPGAVVTLTGTNFNPTAANNIVYFGATKANVTAANATSLTVTAPVGATYAPVTALNAALTVAGIGTSPKPFLPTFTGKGSLTANDIMAKVDFATGTSPCSVAMGDLDGDGKTDLVVANYSAATVSVYRNTSVSGAVTASSFAAKVDFATGTSPRQVAIGDIDGDGKLDLATANYDANTVSVLRNTSVSSGSITTSSFAAKVDFATGLSPASLAIGDLDGDGKPELAATNANNASVSVLRNTSISGSIIPASFAGKIDFATGTTPRSVVIGDLDGDGKPDMAVANNGSNTVSVFRNTSTIGSIASTSFAAKVDFAGGLNSFDLAIGDLDGDGKADLSVVNFGDNNVSVLRNISSSGSITTASFETRVNFATGAGAYSVALGDMDGDGKVDLAVLNANGSTVSVFRNISSSGSITTASFAAKVDFATGLLPYELAIGDLDGDGKPDMAVPNNNNVGSVSVFRNNPLGTIIFNTNGGGGTMANQAIPLGTSASLTANVFARTGYTFTGWNTLANGTGTAYANLANYTMTTDITLYAQWSINTYTITFNGNGSNGGAMSAQSIVYNTSANLSSNGFTRTGYTFTGWNTSANGTGTAYANLVNYTMAASNVTLYAQWTINTYSITFNGNGSDGGAMSAQSIVYNTFSPLTANAFTRTGYSFAGWNTASNGTGTAYANGSSYTMGAGNVILYAQWAANTYSITFNGNGSDGGAMSPQLMAYNTSASLTINGFTRTGFSFAGWNTAANGSGTAYANGVGYTMAGANVTLFAQWVSTPTITGISPASGTTVPGAAVILTGTNFNPTAANNIVYFGAAKANVTAATATSLSVTAPVGATYAPVTALNTALALAGTSPKPFLPTFTGKGSLKANDIMAKVDFAAGAGPSSVAMGDLNGDGKTDLVVANSTAATVSVYRNNSVSGAVTANSFDAKVDFATGTSPRQVAIGDLDGDGKLDLVVANNGLGTVSVFRNTSVPGSITTSSFDARVDFATGSSPTSIAIGDLDGDGKADLSVANAGGFVSVFRNISVPGSITTSSFAAKVDFATGANPLSVAIGDIDGDGKLDLATANNGSNTVSVLRNTSVSGTITTSSFEMKVDFATGSGSSPFSVAIGDLNGDGKPDLAVANFYYGVSVLRNTSVSGSITTASFDTKVDFTTGETAPCSVAMGDLDGDGKLDLAAANYYGNNVSVLRNSSVSGAVTASSFERVDFAAGLNPYSVAIGDIDGDGKPDLAVVIQGSARFSVFRNNPLGTIIYNANGGTAGTMANQAIPLGTSASLTANVFTRTGYTFSGWNTAANGSGTAYANLAIYAMGGTDVTLYAQWTANPYTITFNGNGSDGGAMSAQSILCNASANLSSNGFTRTGYSFAGWNTVANGSGTAYANASSYTMGAGDVILYAQWAVNTYSITFNGNGSDGGAMSAQSIVYNTSANLFTNGFTRTGYSFAGWNTAANGSGIAYANASSYTMGAANVALYAQWTANPYTITFNGNGSDGGAMSAQSIVYNTSANLSSNGFTRTGYTFSAWNTSANGTGTAYANMAIYTMGGDVTLFAQWASTPTITSISPGFGATVPGATVTIIGTNFNPTAASNIVMFGSVKATVTAATTTSLTVTAPVGASYERVTALNMASGLTATSRIPFLNSYSPNKGLITIADMAAKVDIATLAGSAPFAMASGDLDGDGKVDIAVVNETLNIVSVYKNTSTGGTVSFAAKVDFVTGTKPNGIAIGDLDGDGKLDMVVANFGGNSISVYKNTSSAGTISASSFAAKLDIATGQNPLSPVISDLDGDGRPEIAVLNFAGNSLSVFSNSNVFAVGSLSTKVDFATGLSPFSLAIGDLDGDGKPDLAVANSNFFNGNTVSVLRNSHSGAAITAASFAAKVDFATGAIPISVVIGDLDGDGKSDLAVANYNGNSVSVLRNTATSGSIAATSFAAKVDFATGLAPYCVRLGDIDGNGKADLVVANNTGNTVSVLRNASTSGSIVAASFVAKVDFATGTNPRTLAICDFNMDGKADIATASWALGTVSVLRNNPTYTITYNGNGNTAGAVPVAGPFPIASTITIAANTGALVRTGYVFSGWNTNATGTGTTYASSGTATLVLNTNTILYALWVPAPVMSPKGEESIRDSIVAQNSGLQFAKAGSLVTGVGAQENSWSFSIMPNPMEKEALVRFESKGGALYKLHVINSLGQLVYSTGGRASEGINAIDLNLENLSKGLYIVQLVQDGSKQQVNLIKK